MNVFYKKEEKRRKKEKFLNLFGRYYKETNRRVVPLRISCERTALRRRFERKNVRSDFVATYGDVAMVVGRDL